MKLNYRAIETENGNYLTIINGTAMYLSRSLNQILKITTLSGVLWALENFEESTGMLNSEIKLSPEMGETIKSVLAMRRLDILNFLRENIDKTVDVNTVCQGKVPYCPSAPSLNEYYCEYCGRISPKWGELFTFYSGGGVTALTCTTLSPRNISIRLVTVLSRMEATVLFRNISKLLFSEVSVIVKSSHVLLPTM